MPRKAGRTKTLTDPADIAERSPQHSVVIGLNAVIVTVKDETPYVLVVRRKATDGDGLGSNGLPFGPFDPILHRTLESGLRAWVEEQTYLHLGYVEQLYTFGDRGRGGIGTPGDSRIISVGYLALTRGAPPLPAPDTVWHDWYRYLPWEDWRERKPNVIDASIVPAIRQWANEDSPESQKQQRWDRARLCFGLERVPWDEEKALERYELLYEAGLVEEAVRERGPKRAPTATLGEPMASDHRRILATAMGRLRGKLKYRPVVFELMAPTFTLLQLQRTVEAISGIRLHKQNFRRLVDRGGLVEGTGKRTTTGGRPAEEFRFRREAMLERPAPGVRVRGPRRG